jgi:hypothetical protein
MKVPRSIIGNLMEEVTFRRGFGARVAGAIKLDAVTYEAVEADRSALGQALLVVLLSSLATGMGMDPYRGAVALATGVSFALLGWILWAGLIYVIGTTILAEAQTRTTIGELLRTTGFAAAPGVFGLAGLIPGVGPFAVFAVSVWMLMAMIVAIRHALDFTSYWRAVAVVLVGWAVYLIVLFMIPR